MATESLALLLYFSQKKPKAHWKVRERKRGLSIESPSPGIQNVTHTVTDNNTANKKVKIPSLQCSLGVDEKNMQAQK